MERGFKYTFRIQPNQTAMAKGAGDGLKALGIKTVVMLHEDSIFGQGTADIFKKMAGDYGINVLGDVAYSLNNLTDLTTEVSKVQALNPDAVVVTGDGAGAVEEAVRGLAVRCVGAEDFEEGMGRSLAAGLRHLDPACAGALVVLCDQPALTAEHLARLVEAWVAAPASAAASGYAGTVGVPAVLPRAWFPKLMTARGDRGARDLLRENAGEIRVVPDERLSQGVDRPEEAAELH